MTEEQADRLLAGLEELLKSQKETEAAVKEAAETLRDIYSLMT